eukprot:COSAG01_NODE_27943_length_673_cov_0.862369_1_plen_63_part_10
MRFRLEKSVVAGSTAHGQNVWKLGSVQRKNCATSLHKVLEALCASQRDRHIPKVGPLPLLDDG